MEPFEVRIGEAKALVEIDDLESPSWKGAVVDGPALDEGEVTVHLVADGQERSSRAHVVATGAYEPQVLEGLEGFH
jgi:hypothetical protein